MNSLIVKSLNSCLLIFLILILPLSLNKGYTTATIYTDTKDSGNQFQQDYLDLIYDCRYEEFQNVSGFTLSNEAIAYYNCHDVPIEVSDNNLSGSSFISITNSSNVILSSNSMQNYFHYRPQIVIRNSENITIQGNSFNNFTHTDVTNYPSIKFINSSGIHLIGNFIDAVNYENAIDFNMIGVNIVSSSQIKIENNEFRNVYKGIMVTENSSDIEIHNNEFRESAGGIRVVNSCNTHISKNVFQRLNGYGDENVVPVVADPVGIDLSENVTVIGNSFSKIRARPPLGMSSSEYVHIIDNTFDKYLLELKILSSTYVNILNNQLSNYGIYIDGFTFDNTDVVNINNNIFSGSYLAIREFNSTTIDNNIFQNTGQAISVSNINYLSVKNNNFEQVDTPIQLSDVQSYNFKNNTLNGEPYKYKPQDDNLITNPPYPILIGILFIVLILLKRK